MRAFIVSSEITQRSALERERRMVVLNEADIEAAVHMPFKFDTLVMPSRYRDAPTDFVHQLLLRVSSMGGEVIFV